MGDWGERKGEVSKQEGTTFNARLRTISNELQHVPQRSSFLLKETANRGDTSPIKCRDISGEGLRRKKELVTLCHENTGRKTREVESAAEEMTNISHSCTFFHSLTGKESTES